MQGGETAETTSAWAEEQRRRAALRERRSVHTLLCRRGDMPQSALRSRDCAEEETPGIAALRAAILDLLEERIVNMQDSDLALQETRRGRFTIELRVVTGTHPWTYRARTPRPKSHVLRGVERWLDRQVCAA